MRRSRKKNPIPELVLLGANPALHGNPSWPAARNALRNGGDWPAARRALLQSKRNGGCVSRKSRKKNGSLEKAEKLYSDFHGKDATEVIEMQESDVSRQTYTALGDLVDLTIETTAGTVAKIDFSKDDAVKVASAPGGRQLYLIGGSQDLDGALDKFDTDAAKDFVELGRAKQITYRARKSFNDFRLIDYYHDLGEESGNVPLAFYDRLRKRIYFVGGSYHVEAPGIID